MKEPEKKIACSLKADPMLFARLSRLIAESHSLEDVLQSILEEAVWVCGAIRGFLALVDYDRGELDTRYTAGVGWSEEKRIGRLRISESTGKGITSYVAATAVSYRSDNVADDPYYISFFDDVKSEIAVPLVDHFQRVRGVINIESEELAHFDQGHECTMAGLADLAVIAITIADQKARERALLQVGREVNAIADKDTILKRVIDIPAEALKFEDCSLFLRDESTGKLVLRATRGLLKQQVSEAAYDYGEGLTGWTAQAGEPVRVMNPAQDKRWRGRYEEIPSIDVGAFMAVPIFSHFGVIGVLRVQRKRSKYKWFTNSFTEDDESILVNIATQLGIALDNARLIDQLVKTERLAAWGELSARSAHMIGNRVFAIKGDVNELEYYLEMLGADSKKALELSDSIKSGIFLLEEILNEFRDFVKASHLDVEEFDINCVVQEAAREGFPKRSATRLSVDIMPGLPIMKGDAKKLKRCFSEILENSVNFLMDSGEIKVSTGLIDDEDRQWLKPGQRHGAYVRIRFEDNGPGVELKDKPRIFNPFVTSRAKGMGLGLSIVKGVIDSHNGVIYEDGTPGIGARFNILLPYEPESDTSGD